MITEVREYSVIGKNAVGFVVDVQESEIGGGVCVCEGLREEDADFQDVRETVRVIVIVAVEEL